MQREQVSYDTLGSATTPVTLTAAYAGNRQSHPCKYLTNLHLDVKYTPMAAQVDRYLYILVEVSNDDGVTWFPATTIASTTTESDVFDEDTDGNIGIPFILPGDKTSTGGTIYPGFLDVVPLIGSHVRISAKESGAGNNGTVYIRTTLNAN